MTLLTVDMAPAPVIGDVAMFLDVNVDQTAGVVVFVTTHWFPGYSIDMRQPVQPGRGQDPIECRRRQACAGGRLDWAFPQPQPDDSGQWSSSGFCSVSCEEVVLHRLADSIPVSPALHRGPGTLGLRGDLGDWNFLVDNQLRDLRTGARGSRLC